MSSKYVRSLEKCATEKGRRVRIYGVGNGIHTPQDPYETEHVKRHQLEAQGLDWSTLLLGLMMAVQAVAIFYGLLNDVGFRPGLFYDVKYLRLGVLGFMMVVATAVALFHFWIVVQAFESKFMRSLSVLACGGIFFVGFHMLFMLAGGFAHFQVNAVDLHCRKTYNEAECLHARSRLEGIPKAHRKVLARTSSIYGRLRSRNVSEADVALMGLINKAPTTKPATETK